MTLETHTPPTAKILVGNIYLDRDGKRWRMHEVKRGNYVMVWPPDVITDLSDPKVELTRFNGIAVRFKSAREFRQFLLRPWPAV